MYNIPSLKPLLAAHVAEWFARHLVTVGSSLARVTCERSQVLLAGGQVVFLGDPPFSPHLPIDAA